MLRKYPGLFFLAFVVVGIVTADLSRLPAGVFLFGAMAFLLVGLLTTFRSQSLAPLLFALSLGGASAYHFAIEHYDLTPRHIARVVDESRTVQIFGQVSDWPDVKAYQTELKIAVDSLGGSIGQPVEGTILLKVTDTTTALQRGDRVEFWGRIYPVIGGENGGERYDYRRYLHLKGVFGIVYLPTLLDVRIDKRYAYGLFAWVDRIRDEIRGALYAHLSQDAAALASGFLIGETRDIPVHVYQWFRDSGTLHLLAVSGSNVALVLIVIGYLLRPFGLSRRARAIALLVVIVLFTMLSYGEPSVIRASVMASLVILAHLLERRVDLNHVIGLAMLIILVWDPAQMYDVGFQLSFGTAWGLIFLVPKVASRFERWHNRTWYRFLVFPLIISVVAQICSTPLTLYYFGRLPIWSPAANLVIVPLVSAGVIGIMGLLTASLIAPALGGIVGDLLDPLLQLTIKGVELFGGGAGAVIQLDGARSGVWGNLAVVAAYLMLVLAGFAIASKWARRLALWGGLVAVNIVLIAVLFSQSSQRVDGLMLTRIPGGIAALSTTGSSGTGDLVVTGLDAKEYGVDERVILPILKGRKIDSLRYLFVLGSSFLALDDLLRLASSCRADSIFVPKGYGPSIHDAAVVNSLGTAVLSRVAYFPSGLSSGAEDGYFPSAHGVLIRRNGEMVFLSDQESVVPLVPWVPHGAILVMGTTWKPSEKEFAALRQLEAQGLVCAKVAQGGEKGHSATGKELLSHPPCPIYDLSAQDHLMVSFSHPVQLESR